MTRRCIGLLFVAFLAACGGDVPTQTTPATADSVASQWSRVGDWQNSQANAQNTGYVPVTLDPSRFKLLWTSTGNARMATRGLVFTYKSGRTSASGLPEVSALDATNGVPRWTHAAAAGEDLTGVMAADGNAYFVAWGPRGTTLWRLDATTGAGGPVVEFSGMTGPWSSLVLAQSQLLATTANAGGGIYSFERNSGLSQFVARMTNGQDLWLPAAARGVAYSFGVAGGPGYSRIDLSSASPLISVTDTRLLPAVNTVITENGTAIGHWSGHMVAVDAQSGAFKWERQPPNALYAAAAGAVYDVSFAAPAGVLVLSEATGTPIWQWPTPSGAVPSGMVVTKNLLFVQASDTTYALDLATHQAVWKYPVGGASVISPDGILLINGNPLTHPQSLIAISLR